MTDPHDPIEERLRDALRARADSVEPSGVAGAVPAAPAPDGLAHQRRMRLLMGLAAAAAVLVGVGVAAALTSDDGDRAQVISRDDPSTTAQPTTTTAVTTSTGPVTTVAGSTVTGSTVPTTTTEPATTTAPSTTTSTTTTTQPPPSLPGATLDAKSGGHPDSMPVVLKSVRVAPHEGYDRVVFEFDGNLSPGWSVGYADPPFTQDASGEEVQVDGQAFLAIRFSAADAHEMSGGEYHSTVAKESRPSGTARVRELVLTGDFEAVVNLIVGLDRKVPFTVQEVGGPTRIVVDVASQP